MEMGLVGDAKKRIILVHLWLKRTANTPMDILQGNLERSLQQFYFPQEASKVVHLHFLQVLRTYQHTFNRLLHKFAYLLEQPETRSCGIQWIAVPKYGSLTRNSLVTLLLYSAAIISTDFGVNICSFGIEYLCRIMAPAICMAVIVSSSVLTFA